jgi:hypothetical protein
MRRPPREVAKKAGSSALLGGKIAPKPDKVIACLATRLHNFPGQESFLPEHHYFFEAVPPACELRPAALPARALLRAAWISSSVVSHLATPH